MQELQTITPKEYLTRKGIEFRESGKELITRCVFNDCDSDSRGTEAHLYFDTETGQYDCKKCGEKGNLVTLAKHFGDGIQEIALNPRIPTKNIRKYPKFDAELVEACHYALPAHIRQYLNARGITDAVTDAYKLGWGRFYGKNWITIPIKDIYGAFRFFKLRQDPNAGNDKITYPKGVEAQIYGWETLQSEAERIVVCEGELDRLSLLSKEVSVITSTHGAMTFKNVWCEKVGKGRKIYICFDNDETGRKGAERVAKMLESAGNETFIVTLPSEVGDGGDITDYFVKLNGNPKDLFEKYAKEYPDKIDTSQFKPLSSKDLIEILGLTIKKDVINKLLSFLGLLSAYTEDSQINISFNAPSSTGKSFIPTEIADLFPKEDVIEVGYCSPTAFFHDVGEFDKEKQGYIVDLSRKILIFLDQPHTLLLQHLRPFLSHDKKEIRLKITDKSQKAGLRTKNVYLIGYPAVVFCTAGLNIDEQEATRFLLLSPETTYEKLREAIREKIKKEADKTSYINSMESDSRRMLLKQRLLAIKEEHITAINLCDPALVEQLFFERAKKVKPRHQRDIGRLISLVKIFALLNVWHRERIGNNTIIANEYDISEAFKAWDVISESQELNLPPYVYDLYKDVVVDGFNKKNSENYGGIKTGLTRQEIFQKHYEVYGRFLPEWQLKQILHMLETAGLIIQEQNQFDKRQMLIYPTTDFAISQKTNNSEVNGGVTPENPPDDENTIETN